MAMSMIKQRFTISSMHTISGRLFSITLFGQENHKILHPSFSSTESGTCSYHLPLHSRWNFQHSSQQIFFAILSCLFRYQVFARLRKEPILLYYYLLSLGYSNPCSFMVIPRIQARQMKFDAFTMIIVLNLKSIQKVWIKTLANNQLTISSCI